MAQIPRIFDPATQALRAARATRLAGDRFLAAEALEGIAARLAPVTRRFENALALDADAASLPGQWQAGHFGKDERLDAGTGYDLAVSVLALHRLNDLPGALVQIRRALKPDGLFVAALFGGSTLTELRDAFAQGEIDTTGGLSPRVAPMADIRELGGLLQRAGFALPVTDVERTTVRYRDFFTLARDLRAMGETNALVGRKPFLSRATLAAALTHYREKHADADGKLIATFDIVYLLGWAPDESQPKPLRPGSAKTRLADALGVKEHTVPIK